MQTAAAPHIDSPSTSTADAGKGRTRRNRKRGPGVFRVHVTLGVILLVVSIPLIVFLWDDRYTPIPLHITRNTALQVFAIWLLAFFPAWLFIRFLTNRGPALWDEYVVNLHRLGVDGRKYLPTPPEASEYYDMLAQKGQAQPPGRNLYRQKFDAYYGRELSNALQTSSDNKVLVVPTETMFPVVLASILFAVGWAALLSAFGAGAPTDGVLQPLEVVAFAFAGSYVFNLHTLIRRFFQSDLRASAYTSAIARVITSTVIARTLYEVPPLAGMSEGLGLGSAFVLGFFPLAGLQALRRLAAGVLGLWVHSLRSTHPLSDIRGMNLWYEARLVEEGIEDIQELATANIVDVLLHTRVPVSRLVDWLDQAHLLLYLEPARKKKTPQDDPAMTLREALETYGIRKATTFLIAFGAYRPVDAVAVHKQMQGISAENGGQVAEQKGLCRCWEPDEHAVLLAKDLCGQARHWTETMVLTLVRVIANDTSITPVLNWRHWGAERLFELERGLVTK